MGDPRPQYELTFKLLECSLKQNDREVDRFT